MLWYGNTPVIVFKAKVANVKRYSFKEMKKSAFRGSLKYTLVREVCISSISDSYVASRVHKLARRSKCSL